MLIGTLGTSLFGNLLTEKGIYRAGGIVRAGYGRPSSSASHNNKTNF